ncbi:hypothetical protein [Hallella bergensis]|uniref:hypothetical protein n=1 Tax=Hallella bergensis TaxID=242750 RepID=UPI0023F37A2A|nr:hypothetical protein [Hallella bergensis]
MKDKKAITFKTLTKSNVWDIQESDVFRMWEAAERDADLKENMRRYTDIIRSAFDLEEVKIDKPEVIKKYEARGFKIGLIRTSESAKQKFAVKKRPIQRVTDLTYENIRHISAPKLIEVLERNFGGGWGSLSQSVQDIIESGFDISTTTLPKDRLHKEGGLYEKKITDGFEVLEIPKGLWVEAIFAKEKPEKETYKAKAGGKGKTDDDIEDFEDDEELPEDNFKQDDEDDGFDEDKLTEESYRTTYDADPEDLNYEAEELSDDSDF